MHSLCLPSVRTSREEGLSPVGLSACQSCSVSDSRVLTGERWCIHRVRCHVESSNESPTLVSAMCINDNFDLTAELTQLGRNHMHASLLHARCCSSASPASAASAKREMQNSIVSPWECGKVVHPHTFPAHTCGLQRSVPPGQACQKTAYCIKNKTARPDCTRSSACKRQVRATATDEGPSARSNRFEQLLQQLEQLTPSELRQYYKISPEEISWSFMTWLASR